HAQGVQHLEGGIVRAIHVKEGETVKAGQLLLTLDGAGSEDDLSRAQVKQAGLALQEERLRAYIEGRRPDFSAYAQKHPEQVRDQMMFFEGMIKARDEDRKIVREQITQKRRMIATLQSELETEKKNYAI